MTCREKLAKEHPECISDMFVGGCKNCPHDYDYLNKPDYCRENNSEASCRRCWDREIPGIPEEPKRPETFHEKLVRTIEDVGQEIIDNAEDYAGSSPYLSRMTIAIDFDPSDGPGGMYAPEIAVDKTYACGRIINRLRGE